MPSQTSCSPCAQSSSRCIVVIPARWGATRFPGKALHPIAGRPLVQHVWERCLKARFIESVFIATDDRRIQRVAEGFGAEVIMTSKKHQSGTDRTAEVMELLEKEQRHPTHVINVQGDEPLIHARLIDRLAKIMLQDPQVEIITAATAMKEELQHHDPNLVKVVVNVQGKALYFSRSTIPFHRDIHDQKSAVQPLLHLGIYGFRGDILKRFVMHRPSPLERCEKLEQLRALEYGMTIRVVTTSHQALGVDTLEDAERIEKYFRSK